MHLSHISQCTIANRNVRISVRNGVLWDMGKVHNGICENWSMHAEGFTGSVWSGTKHKQAIHRDQPSVHCEGKCIRH